MAFFSLSQRLTAEVITIHKASDSPRLTRGFHSLTRKGMTIPAIALAANAQRKRTANSGRLAFFQRAAGPTPSKNMAGTITATKIVLK